MPGRLKVLSVVGARPNMMKVAPVAAALGRRPEDFEHVLVDTGQHYDHEMSQIFLEELGVGEPDYRLGIGSGTQAQQTARALEGVEEVLLREQPDVVLVPGDVNSTLAASLAAAKLGPLIGHIEAGLRSFDRTMPEEVNRIVADVVSDLHFIHSPEARENLLAEGHSAGSIHDVGNTMIDTLVAMRRRIDEADAPTRHGLTAGAYLVATLHRPALVDTPLLADALRELALISDELPVLFPVHPRTRERIASTGLTEHASKLLLTEPLGYVEFLSLLAASAGAVTDSGGIQEETTYLGIPCFTLRTNTERPVTVHLGTNTLLGLDPGRISEIPGLIAERERQTASVPPLWDGRAGERIIEVLARLG